MAVRSHPPVTKINFVSLVPRNSILRFVRPVLALLNTRSFVSIGRIKGKFMELSARKLTAKAAIGLSLVLTAGFDGADLSPKRFFDIDTSRAFHDFTIFTFAAKQAAPGFNHAIPLLFANIRDLPVKDSKVRWACQIGSCPI